MTKKPLAFVDDSGYVVPNPVFSEMSVKYARGRFLYTQTEVKEALEAMNARTLERRYLADKEYGNDMVRADPAEADPLAIAKELDGVRETVPSFNASPNRKRTQGGISKKLKQPNEIPLPDSFHEEPRGMNLTEEERADMTGIDTGNAVHALFGGN